MKQHIETAPIWEVYQQPCECPLCVLNTQVEAGSVEYFLGESVMEPDQRIEVNKKGFCARHFKQMYDAGNRLGLALMTQTYMKNTAERLRDNTRRLQEAAGAGAGKGLLWRIGAGKGNGMRGPVEELREIMGTCALCDRLEQTMERYVYTVLYMYRHEPEFPALFAKSQGMCLTHYARLLEAAPSHLSGETLKQFVATLTDIELKSFDRLQGEVDWFVKKFDYRNQNEPWGTSRDSVKRAVNKLRVYSVDRED